MTDSKATVRPFTYCDLAKLGKSLWNKWAENRLSKSELEDIREAIGVEELPTTDKEIDLSNIDFKNDVDFSGFIFPAFVDFSGSEFRHNKFSATKFLSGANFGNSKFFEHAEFQRAIFEGKANFKDAMFLSRVSMNGTSFLSEADFRNVQFTTRTNFSYGRFDLPPDFSDTVFSQNTSFMNRKFNAYKKNDDRYPYDSSANMWRVLKHAMHEIHNREMELVFYGYEIDCRTKIADWRQSILFRLYKATSNYGQSISLPIFYLLLSIIAFAWIYSVLVDGASPYEFVSISIANSLPFLKSSMMIMTDPSSIGNLSQGTYFTFSLIAVVQSIISLVFIFLIGLGIRNLLSIK